MTASFCFFHCLFEFVTHHKFISKNLSSLSRLTGLSGAGEVRKGAALLSFWGVKVLNAQFEEESCATFIVLFYRPLPDSWRDFKTTTCPHFTPAAFSLSRPLPSSPCPAHPGQRQVRGSTVSLSLFLFPLWGKTDTSSVARDSHLHLTSRSPPSAPPQLLVNSAATPPWPAVILQPLVCLY